MVQTANPSHSLTSIGTRWDFSLPIRKPENKPLPLNKSYRAAEVLLLTTKCVIKINKKLQTHRKPVKQKQTLN